MSSGAREHPAATPRRLRGIGPIVVPPIQVEPEHLRLHSTDSEPFDAKDTRLALQHRPCRRHLFARGMSNKMHSARTLDQRALDRLTAAKAARRGLRVVS